MNKLDTVQRIITGLVKPLDVDAYLLPVRLHLGKAIADRYIGLCFIPSCVIMEWGWKERIFIMDSQGS